METIQKKQKKVFRTDKEKKEIIKDFVLSKKSITRYAKDNNLPSSTFCNILAQHADYKNKLLQKTDEIEVKENEVSSTFEKQMNLFKRAKKFWYINFSLNLMMLIVLVVYLIKR